MEHPKPARWNLQTAKAKLSELVDSAQAGQPQLILRRGKPAAVVVSLTAYEALHPPKSLVSYLLHSPLLGSGLDLSHADEPYEVRPGILTPAKRKR